MSYTQTLILAFWLLIPSFAHGQSMPAKLRTYLNIHYSGWKQTSVASLCSRDFARSIVAGDFDGDGKRDYAVKFVRGRSGYIIAFLERRTNYERHILFSGSAAGVRSTGLSLHRKGEQYPVGGDYPDLVYGRLPNDAPVTGDCGSHAWPHVYRNGRFQ